MNRIVAGLLACALMSAIGGFGAPLLCRGGDDDRCADRWRGAAAGALTAAGTLGTLLARMGGDQP
jgi:hypothetical protein